MNITFPGEYPSLNEYINAERRNRFIAAKIKKEATARAMEAAKETLDIVVYPLECTCIWYTKNERKDPDKVAFAIKFLLDGLVEAGVLRNDTRKEISSITHRFVTDKNAPRVELHLVPAIRDPA